MISGQQVYFFLATLVGRIFFFPPKIYALQDIFFPLLISLQEFFFPSKKCRVYIYRMCLHLHCGYCSNSSNIELQIKALKCCKLYKIILV